MLTHPFAVAIALSVKYFAALALPLRTQWVQATAAVIVEGAEKREATSEPLPIRAWPLLSVPIQAGVTLGRFEKSRVPYKAPTRG
jgi:hypothetical protein